MLQINENFLKLSSNYLFADIARKVQLFQAHHPGQSVISLGIGDVTQPLPPACIEAMQKAVSEMGNRTTFHGYGPEQGYDFLRKAILQNDYEARGVQLELNEIFISDGAKSDCGNLGDILGIQNTVAITDPVYPVYIDSNVMSGRAGTWEHGRWSQITYLPCNQANGFMPALPSQPVDLIYLCYPNNPTGTVLGKEALQKWVDYALANQSLILYDAAYEAYIQDASIPHSIYELEGAKQCAIELRSFSKTAGFTGVRCGYTVVPQELTVAVRTGEKVKLNTLWNRRQCTKFNGTSYITQRGAEAIYMPDGKQQVKETINYYMSNARAMKVALLNMGYNVTGGENAPYLWVKTPDNLSSWQFFDYLLNQAHVIVTPGVGFGPSGEGYVRLTAFGKQEDCSIAIQRIREVS